MPLVLELGLELGLKLGLKLGFELFLITGFETVLEDEVALGAGRADDLPARAWGADFFFTDDLPFDFATGRTTPRIKVSNWERVLDVENAAANGVCEGRKEYSICRFCQTSEAGIGKKKLIFLGSRKDHRLSFPLVRVPTTAGAHL